MGETRLSFALREISLQADNVCIINFWCKMLMCNAYLPVLSISCFVSPIAELRTYRGTTNFRTGASFVCVINGLSGIWELRIAPNEAKIRSWLEPVRTSGGSDASMSRFSENRSYSESAPPGSGAVRLDDFLNPPPSPPSQARQGFESAVARIMRLRGLPRPEAERAAYEIVLIERLNATHPDTPSDRCAMCRKLEEPGAVLLPIGVGARHTWLHRDCWDSWRARRRAEAVSWLGTMGIGPP
jgi:hypothetical protein